MVVDFWITILSVSSSFIDPHNPLVFGKSGQDQQYIGNTIYFMAFSK